MKTETQKSDVAGNGQQTLVSGCSTIQFKQKFQMQNGNKVTKKNWHKVFAISSKPCTGTLGYPAIEETKRINGHYYEKWKLVYEKADSENDRPSGYIFREINHGGGINGRHKTFKQAIWRALEGNHITVWLQE